jgi:signal transduction histidine kinase
LVDAVLSITGATVCVAGPLEPGWATFRVVASEPAVPGEVIRVPERVRTRLWKDWVAEPVPVVLDDPWVGEVLGRSMTAGLVVPCSADGLVSGLAVAGVRARSALDDDELRTLAALAGVAAPGFAAPAADDRARAHVKDVAVLAERERIVADLHDTVGQTLVGLGLLALRHAEELGETSPAAARATRLAELASEAKLSLEQVVRGLRLAPVGRRGLVASLRALARAIGADSGLPISVQAPARLSNLPDEVAQVLFRVAREALCNAWRHAQCTRIDIELERDEEGVTLTVVDDGVGLRRRGGPGVRMGMDGMRKVVGHIGGSLQIHNVRPHGVMVKAFIPGG